MSAARGRPFSENPKETMLRVRLDKKTLEKLEECARRLGTTKSDIVRTGIEKIFAEAEKR